MINSVHTLSPYFFFFFFNDTATTEIYTLSLHDALPISFGFSGQDAAGNREAIVGAFKASGSGTISRSEEHTSELQSRLHLVCRLLLEKKKDTLPPAGTTANPSAGSPAQASGSCHLQHNS